MLNFLKKSWPMVVIGLFLSTIIILNIHPGKVVMGNDNFSPEINPQLSVVRSLASPAWRDYRVLGIPSDSEQGDIWRSLLFWIGKSILPTWVLSQGYLFITLIIGVVSMGKVAQLLNQNRKSAQFFGSLMYLFSPITVWIYFYPVHLFVAAYAFTPFVLWMFFKLLLDCNRKNKIFLLIASLLMGTTALTATMFITCALTITTITFFASLATRKMISNWLIGMAIFILPQLFWFLPFTTYVKNNSQALQDSYINREITATTVESEQSNNIVWNTLRFSSSWMDTKENDLDYTYPSRSWFKDNKIGFYLGFMPVILALVGIIYSIINLKKNYDVFLISTIGIVGWIFLNGNNPPFNTIYGFFDQNIPLFHQVFRWGSSKFWPILLIPMIVLATKGLDVILEQYQDNKVFSKSLKLGIAVLIIVAIHPILTNKLIRNEVFIELPSVYSDLKSTLTNHYDSIDVAPHTNTRYFRKYSWGFWGSVFLNYLLPNPTTEKALIIGSYENEDAFTLLDESYYSGRVATYSNALARYKIPYILSDLSVTNTGLGSSYSFPYNFNQVDQMTTQNPYFKEIWSQGFLSLHRNNNVLIPKLLAIASNHNTESLNKSLATLGINQEYVVSTDSGTIFPLSLNQTKVQTTVDHVTLSSTIMSSGDYNLSISQDTLSTAPLMAQVNSNQLSLTPYFPTLMVDDHPIYQLPITTAQLTSTLVSIEDKIITEIPTLVENIDTRNTFEWSHEQNLELTNPIKELPCNQDQNQPTNQSCQSTEITIKKSGPIQLTATYKSSAPMLVDICLHSKIYNSCINDDKTIISSQEQQVVTTNAHRIAKAGDHIVIFFTVKSMQEIPPSLEVSNLSLSQASNQKPIVIKKPDIKNINHTINLTLKNQLGVQLPQTTLIPAFKVFRPYCAERTGINTVIDDTAQITLTTSNCFDGLYTNFSLPPNLDATALLTYIQSSHFSGIPFEYNLKESLSTRKLATDLLPSNQPTGSIVMLTLLPSSTSTFTAEIVNQGIGKNPSSNQLTKHAIIPIPTSWLSLALTPTQIGPEEAIVELKPFLDDVSTATYLGHIQKGQKIYTIPAATSPYWKAVLLQAKPHNIVSQYWNTLMKPAITDKVNVNGWQDGWNVNTENENQYLSVVFLPNVLAYLGLVVGLTLVSVIILRQRPSKTS